MPYEALTEILGPSAPDPTRTSLIHIQKFRSLTGPFETESVLMHPCPSHIKEKAITEIHRDPSIRCLVFSFRNSNQSIEAWSSPDGSISLVGSGMPLSRIHTFR